MTRLPVLAIRGENSDLLSEETLTEMEVRHPGLERFIVPGQGHAPLLRDSASITRIASFIGRIEDTKPLAVQAAMADAPG